LHDIQFGFVGQVVYDKQSNPYLARPYAITTSPGIAPAPALSAKDLSRAWFFSNLDTLIGKYVQASKSLYQQ